MKCSGTATLVQNLEDKNYYISKKINMNNLDDKAKKHALLEVWQILKTKNMWFFKVDILKTLNHPNIVAYKDSYLINNNNLLIIIMEYCQGLAKNLYAF